MNTFSNNRIRLPPASIFKLLPLPSVFSLGLSSILAVRHLSSPPLFLFHFFSLQVIQRQKSGYISEAALQSKRIRPQNWSQSSEMCASAITASPKNGRALMHILSQRYNHLIVALRRLAGCRKSGRFHLPGGSCLEDGGQLRMRSVNFFERAFEQHDPKTEP